MRTIKRTFVFTLLISICLGVKCQNSYQERLENSKDKNEMFSILEEWEASDSVCPRVYYYLTNVYTKKAELKKKEGILGFLDLINQTKINYDKNVLQTAFDYSNKGVSLFPDVITLRLSNIEVCRHLEDYEMMVSGIKKLFAHAEMIHNEWLSADENTEIEKQIDNMLHVCYLVPEQDDNMELIKYSKDIADIVLKYIPDNSPSLLQLLSYYLYKEKDKKAEAVLKRLAIVSNTEKYVLPSLALGYAKLGDKANAMEYLRRMKENPDNSESYIKSITEDVVNALKGDSL